MDIEIITSRDLAENRGWPRPGRRPLPEASRESRRAELDCRTCAAPASACGDCVMGVLLQIDGVSSHDADLLTPDEERAVEALSSGGLLPPLRHRAAS